MIYIEHGDGFESSTNECWRWRWKRRATAALEGGIPIGAALFTKAGELVSRGHNRRVQQGDPSMHGETDAFRRAGPATQLS